MHIQTALHQLGYPMNQVKIYLAALKMGEGTIADIAEQVNMPRTTVTELLAEMSKHGLMNYYTKKSRKVWVAENPDKLMVIVKEREAALKAVLPQLHAMKFDSGLAKPNIRCYIGAKEVVNVYDDIIEASHNILAVVSWDDVNDFLGSDFMSDFVERRHNHFLKIRLITPKTTLSQKLKARDAEESRQTRFLPEQISLRHVSNFIYGDKVAMISFNRKNPTGIIIQDPDIAHAQTIYFESLWRHSTES